MTRTPFVALLLLAAAVQTGCTPRLLAAAAVGLVVGATVAHVAQEVERESNRKSREQVSERRVVALECLDRGPCRERVVVERCYDDGACDYDLDG
jgi:hypothetical protein